MTEGREYSMELQWARPGDIVVAKIDLKNGAVGIVPDDWENVVVTTHFAVYEPNRERVDPEFFHRLIQAPFFKAHLWRNKVGAEGRKEVKLSFFEQMAIPLPPLPVQQAIVARWKEAQAEIAALRSEIAEREASVPRIIQENLGYATPDMNRLPKCNAVNWSELITWNVSQNRFTWKVDELFLSEKFDSVPLVSVARINPLTDFPNPAPEDVTFVPMEAVDDKSGTVARPQTRKRELVRTGYTRFAEEDVLWAKITPCMQNGKCAVARNLQDGSGYGSTEFHVFRSRDTEVLLPDYLWLLLRLPLLKQAAQRYFIGSAGQQRVPVSFFEQLSIPLPPLSVQREIIARVADARTRIADARAEADTRTRAIAAETEAALLGSVPLEMDLAPTPFPSPAARERGVAQYQP